MKAKKPAPISTAHTAPGPPRPSRQLKTGGSARSVSTGKPKALENAIARPESVHVSVPAAFPPAVNIERAIVAYGAVAVLALQYTVRGTHLTRYPLDVIVFQVWIILNSGLVGRLDGVVSNLLFPHPKFTPQPVTWRPCLELVLVALLCVRIVAQYTYLPLFILGGQWLCMRVWRTAYGQSADVAIVPRTLHWQILTRVLMRAVSSALAAGPLAALALPSSGRVDVVPVCMGTVYTFLFVAVGEYVNIMASLQWCMNPASVTDAFTKEAHLVVASCGYWEEDGNNTEAAVSVWAPGIAYSDSDFVSVRGGKRTHVFRAVGNVPPALHPQSVPNRLLQIMIDEPLSAMNVPMYILVAGVVVVSECALTLRRWEVYMFLSASSFALLCASYRFGYAAVAQHRIALIKAARTAAATPVQQ